MATALVDRASPLGISERIAIQAERIRRQEFKTLGRVVVIALELNVEKRTSPAWDVARSRLDWGDGGPLLAMSHDQQDLLLPSGVCELPKIKDPSWTPRVPTQEETEAPNWKPQGAPEIPQSWTERAAGQITHAGENWLIFQPVVQVIFRPFGVPTFAIAQCKPAAWNGTRTALLVNPKTFEAYLYGGSFEIGVR